MMPVRMCEKSVRSKSGCVNIAMNIVGTPWKHVTFSRSMHASEDFGEKYGIGRIVAPCVIEAVIASTMPKQWNIGTWIIMRSAVERPMRSPMHLPLLTTL